MSLSIDQRHALIALRFFHLVIVFILIKQGFELIHFKLIVNGRFEIVF